MNSYIALFRGINVGGNNILPMKSLVTILEDLGCENIKTYIQSGNAVFKTRQKESSKIAEQIGQKIFDNYSFKPRVLLLDLADFQDAVDNNPFNTDNGKALHFYFMAAPPEDFNPAPLNKIKTESEKFQLIKNVFYFYAPDGIGRSKLAANFERLLKITGTGRNWNTVNKLLSMVS